MWSEDIGNKKCRFFVTSSSLFYALDLPSSSSLEPTHMKKKLCSEIVKKVDRNYIQQKILYIVDIENVGFFAKICLRAAGRC